VVLVQILCLGFAINQQHQQKPLLPDRVQRQHLQHHRRQEKQIHVGVVVLGDPLIGKQRLVTCRRVLDKVDAEGYEDHADCQAHEDVNFA